MLINKNILLGVTGSIAIYKSLELIRLLVKSGAVVKVIMTQSAKKFITPLTFETLTSNKVLDDENEDWTNENNHIDIGKWADIFVIAPCTANTINKLNNGLADNFLTSTALAYPKVKIIAPAANTNMIQNPFTQASLKMLKICNYKIISTQSKELACKDIGDGALADVQDIFFNISRELLADEYYRDRKVVISGGGTIEKIDDVRYISNFSSGKMANALATALYLRGADVCLITTREYENIPNGIHTISVESSQEMNRYLIDALRVAKKGKMSSPTLMNNSNPHLITKTPYLFMVAAISDYITKFPQNGKLKKSLIGVQWDLELKQNIDILSSLEKQGIISIGFKTEMEKDVAKENAIAMLENKNIDGVCLNVINSENPFGGTSNKIEFFSSKSCETVQIEGDKLDISSKLLDILKMRFKDE